ncbi:hypothetical protein A374_11070 [Fictibacillus macauensis ZFHKF-1]|uniref:DUF1510 domain-containing protein n=1 Tax=Fictibacillus macauensis ZFHKF-1 TaxID=1196324 RepID=I8UEE7_9BACL|nr:YrrS family protein [Fictibacillus macauensis]EIT85280.1 hypothetical protein A374_11070 [Fictibacillus macauensis ZFHKF-1]
MSKKHNSRFERRKQNRTLNIAIIIVIVLIVAVGFGIFKGGGDDRASSSKDTPSTSSANDANKSANDQANHDRDKEKEDSKEDKEKKDEKKEGGGPNGPWEAVGTSQKGEHTKSYDKGSTDWDEQLKALSYATGIAQDEMTLLWLGNGGGPDRSLGRVLSKKDGSRYEVQLQWENDKGWKPLAVKKQS